MREIERDVGIEPLNVVVVGDASVERSGLAVVRVGEVVVQFLACK